MNQNPRSSSPHLRWRVFAAILLALIIVEVITVAAVILPQQFRTNKALQLHTRQQLKGVVDETRENAQGFMTQAQSGVLLSQDLFASGQLSLLRIEQLERYFLAQLRIVSQVDGFFFGTPDGEFMFVKRDQSQPAGRYLTKLITFDGAERRVERTWRDDNLEEVAAAPDPDDNYDPRQRPWYQLASDSGATIWTDPYMFFTSRRPGLTVAAPVLTASGDFLGVVGADVELSSLSSFLADQPVTRFGAAVIAHQNGEVLAYPFPEKLFKTTADGQLRLAKLDELDIITAKAAASLSEMPALTNARFSEFTHDNESFAAMFVPFFAERDWVMGVYAPQKHFSGTIQEGQRFSMLWAIIISVAITTTAFFIGVRLLRPLARIPRADELLARHSDT